MSDPTEVIQIIETTFESPSVVLTVGQQGPKGAKGDVGEKGEQGEVGPSGSNGTSSISTDANNQSRLGTDGGVFTPLFDISEDLMNLYNLAKAASNGP